MVRFGMLVFDRVKGPQTDVKELEFVSALMQTDDPLRVDGTLRPQDIALYLHSRFGLNASVETVEQLIFQELAGRTLSQQESSSTLDLCQLVALLAIPQLLQAAQDDQNRDLLDWFQQTFNEVTTKHGSTKKLTRKALREAFESFDEFGLPDDVLDSMIQVAATVDGGFSLEQALTGDLGAFDLDWKNRCTTTNLEDVLSVQPTPVAEQSLSQGDKQPTQHDLLRQRVTAPFIDFIAENYRRRSFVMFLWGAGVITYVAHIFLVTDSKSYDYWAEVDCEDSLSEMGCSIVKGIVTWLATMVQLATLGFVFIILGSMGNSIYSSLYKISSTFGLLLAMGVVAISTIVPYFVGVNTSFFWTYGNKDYTDYYYETEEPTFAGTEDPTYDGTNAPTTNGPELVSAATPEPFPSGSPTSLIDSVLTGSPTSLIDSVLTSSPTSLIDSVLTDSPTSLIDSVLTDSPTSLIDSVLTNSPTSLIDSVLTNSPTSLIDSSISTASPSPGSSFERNLEWVSTEIPYDASTDPYASSYYLSLGLGCVLIAIQVIDLLAIFAPRFLCAIPKLQSLFIPSGLKAEAFQQQAAFFKTSQMMRSALHIHTEDDDSDVESRKMKTPSKMCENQSSQTHALLKYQQKEVEKVREEIGGSFWTWKKIFDGSLAREEGVWIHSRLLACTMAQLIIVIGICFLASLAYKNAYQFVYSTNDSIDVQANRILEAHLNSSYACLNEEFMKLTGTATPTRLVEQAGSAANIVSKAVGSSGVAAGSSLLQPLSIDQMLAYSEYWLPEEDAPVIKQVLYDFTLDSIDGCLEKYETEQQFVTEMTAIRWCVEDNTDFWLYPSYMFHLQYDSDFGDAETVFSLLRDTCGGSDELVTMLLNTTYDEVEENEDKWSDLAESLELSQMDYKLVVSFAFVTSITVAIYLLFVTVPSYVSQVLRFRAGVIPSLDDLGFLRLRKALDTSTTLFAASFWGSLYTSIASGVVVGGIVLCIVSTFDGDMGRKIFAAIVGFLVVLVFRMIVLIILRGRFFTNLYRKNALGANIFFVILEAWSVALSVGFVIARIIKVLLVSMFFIARIDTAILAPGVGRIGPIELDSFPYSFRKDLVLHEAHRHPYIESLGVLFLLKLRCGKSFGNRPNACWRLLFVLALMPWLQKYRVSGYEDGMDITELQDKIAAADDEPSRRELEEELGDLIKRHEKSDDKEIEVMKKELEYLRKRVVVLMKQKGCERTDI